MTLIAETDSAVVDDQEIDMKLAFTESQSGLAYLSVGVITSLVFAAIGALETQRPLLAVMWAFGALLLFIGIFELAALLKATASKRIALGAVIGIALAFGGLAIAIEAGRGKDWVTLPQSWLFWVLPAAAAIYGLVELARK